MPHGEDDDRDRVDQGALDLAFQRFGPFLELGQTLENDFQGTARLAGLDHVDVEPVEGLGRLWPWPRRAWTRLRSRRRRRSGRFSGRRAAIAPARIFRLRRMGRPASCRIESWRVKVVSVLRFDAAEGEGLALFCRLSSGAAWLPALLDGDLRDEVAHLPDRRLRLVLAGRLDDVLDLLAGGVHRLELIGRHGSIPLSAVSYQLFGQTSVKSYSYQLSVVRSQLHPSSIVPNLQSLYLISGCRFADHFLDRGDAVEDLFQAGVAQAGSCRSAWPCRGVSRSKRRG